MNYHEPVLLKESIEGLNIKPEGIYVDVTYGGGGHSREIIKYIKGGKLLGFDQDEDAERNKIEDERFLFVKHNFRFMKNFLSYYGFSKVDGIIADLGVSSHQLDVPNRGFSYRTDGSLDLRMNQKSKLSAADIVNNFSQEQLLKMFSDYADIKGIYRLVKLIIEGRSKQAITGIKEFIEIISPCIPRKIENKYLSQVFQALRIEVNREMEFLKEFLLQADKCIVPGGRLVVISYHSIEDRIVKNYFKKGLFTGEPEKDLYGNYQLPFKMISRSVITPTEQEIQKNKRSRSAKMRIAEKM